MLRMLSRSHDSLEGQVPGADIGRVDALPSPHPSVWENQGWMASSAQVAKTWTSDTKQVVLVTLQIYEVKLDPINAASGGIILQHPLSSPPSGKVYFTVSGSTADPFILKRVLRFGIQIK